MDKQQLAMLAVLDNHKEDLKLLYDKPTQIFADFCKLAWNSLKKGHNIKLYQAASQKLKVDVKQIQSGVEGLAYLFIEAVKYELDEEGFKEALINLGIPENSFSVIYNEYLSQKDMLDFILPQVGIQHYEFKDLEWRFEAQVSSKSLRQEIKPRVILKLELEKKGQAEGTCLQSDIPNIIHMNHLISQALQESKTHHSKRIQRAVT